MSKQLPQMKTYCVGRYLVDLPGDFVITNGSTLELVYGLGKDWTSVVVRPLPGGEPASERLKRAVEAKLAEMKRRDKYYPPDQSMISVVRAIDPTTTLVRASDEVPGTYISRVFRVTGNAAAVFEAQVYSKDRPEDVEARLLRLSTRSRDIAQGNDGAQGVCIGGLALDGGQDGEWITIAYRSASFPDVVVDFEMNSTVEESDGGLLKRSAERRGLAGAAGFPFAHTKVLRKGKTELAGRSAEEYLDADKDGPNADKNTQYFVVESMPEPATLAKPRVSITMTTGGQNEAGEYVNSSLSDKDALALWDEIKKSFRPRPGAL
jgi:hypothetical protein